MRFTLRDLFWLTTLIAACLWAYDYTCVVERRAALFRSYTFAVAYGYVKEFSDSHGMGDLEMQCLDPNRPNQTPATAHDETRWWHKEVAQGVFREAEKIK